MKKSLFYLAIASLSFLACSKSDDSNNGPPASDGLSTKVFYQQRHQIYSTNLKGENKKTVVEEADKSQSNYIFRPSIMGIASKQIVYAYADDSKATYSIKVVNIDGSNVKIIKTLPKKDTYITLLKGLSNGLVLFQVNTVMGSVTTNRTFTIKADGTGETELSGAPYDPYLSEQSISADGSSYINSDGKFNKITNGSIDNANSFDLISSAEKTNFYDDILSGDAKKAALIYYTRPQKKLEIKIKDVVKNSPAAVTLFTAELPANADDETFEICFVNGTKNILVSFSTRTAVQTPNPEPDYTSCQLIDASTGKVINAWKIVEAGNRSILTD